MEGWSFSELNRISRKMGAVREVAVPIRQQSELPPMLEMNNPQIRQLCCDEYASRVDKI
jgi:hypothetical protein